MNPLRNSTRLALTVWLALGLVAVFGNAARADMERNFAGSVQLDYLAVATEKQATDIGFDAATVELSLKIAIDHGNNITSQVKLCYACHGIEFGMAFFDVRFADQFNIRVGRFTPAFGEFPLRHDPANHRTSDKPLAYDMGRMLRLGEWNLGVLPAPWVDNGVEINGSHFFGNHQIDYAVYAIGGPRANGDVSDFQFSPLGIQGFYLDNNSRPAGGGRLSGTLSIGEISSVSLGVSGMGGTYDPNNNQTFGIVGADLVLRLSRLIIRAEYLVRRTEIDLGDDPQNAFRFPDDEVNDTFDKHGFDFEIEQPIGNLDIVARYDGLRRIGPVVRNSPLDTDSFITRYTIALSYRLRAGLRLKTSAEYYEFKEFDAETAFHFGLAGPF